MVVIIEVYKHEWAQVRHQRNKITWYRCGQHLVGQQSCNRAVWLPIEACGDGGGDGLPGLLGCPLYGTSISTNSRSYKQKPSLFVTKAILLWMNGAT